MANLKPGDYVRPIVNIEGTDYTGAMSPAKVTTVYKNGNIHCTTDDGRVSHHAPASGFQKVKPPSETEEK